MQAHHQRPTQASLILRHLKKGSTITSLDALKAYGCARLGARIHELKQDGHNIEREMITVNTAHGQTAHVASYSLAAPSA